MVKVAAMSKLIMPFSPKWLGIKDFASRPDNYRNIDHSAFELSRDSRLSSYFPTHRENCMFQLLLTAWDDWTIVPPRGPFLPNKRNMRSQPTWKFPSREAMIAQQGIWDYQGRPNRRRGLSNDPKVTVAPLSKSCCLAPMRYHPASFVPSEDYGIHMPEIEFIRIAQGVNALCPEQPREVVLVTTSYFAYCHLAAHAWIEDICSILDFHGSEDPHSSDRRYLKAHRRYGGYLFMEEALCNLAALSLLPAFLSVDKGTRKLREIPDYDARQIIGAIVRWLGGSYALDVPLDRPFFAHREFLYGIERLLFEVYDYRDAIVTDRDATLADQVAVVLANFFGAPLLPGQGHTWMSRPDLGLDRVDSQLVSFDGYPVY
jgi:hypothetical protein